MDDLFKKTQEFWNANLCGMHFVKENFLTREFFDAYSAFRYTKEHHLNQLVDWEFARGKDVIEVGLGIGADAVRWTKSSNSFAGVDATEQSVYTTKLHFQQLGLRGSVIRGNAESLPFRNRTFDIFYSHGVLHHLSNIDKALAEAYRVLKPGGIGIIMLYCKDSFNYIVRIQVYFRFRFLLELLKFKLNRKIEEHWMSHVRNFMRYGWTYFAWSNWYHHCTDGPDCPIANIYHKSEVSKMMRTAGFEVRRMRKAHLPLGGRFPSLERLMASRIGFYLFVWVAK